MNDILKCIIYNKCQMMYAEVYPTSVEQSYLGGSARLVTFTGAISDGKIELDSTTMQRIAKYNAEKELELTNAKLKVAQLELESLTKKLKRFNEKYKEIIQFIDNDFRSQDEDEYYD